MTTTICVDKDGRVIAVLVPEGGCATLIQVDGDTDGDFFGARFGAGENEVVFRYDPEHDAGMRDEVPRYYRNRWFFTIHRPKGVAT